MPESKESKEAAPAPITNWPDAPSKEAYHGLAGDLVRTLEPHTESDPIAILVQFLVAFGNCVGRAPHFRVEADRHYLNLFVSIVGQTSKARKGTSAGQVRSRFRQVDSHWEKDRIVAGLSSGEGLIWAVRDEIRKKEPLRERGRVVDYEEVIADSGVDDKRLLVLESELASTLRALGREGNTLSAVIRQAWDIGILRTLTKNSPVVATDAHVSIVGHITKLELLRHLDSTEAGNGFANRFLWICARRSKYLPDGGAPDTRVLDAIDEQIKVAVDFGRTCERMVRSEDASQIWRDVYPALSEGQPGLFGAVISRAEAQVTRLACIYALLDCSRVIMPEHLLAALALWEYAEASARFIFGDALGDPVADEILRALRSTPTGLTRTEIRDLFGRNRGAPQIHRALALLAEGGLARVVTEETEGRPAERWLAILPSRAGDVPPAKDEGGP